MLHLSEVLVGYCMAFASVKWKLVELWLLQAMRLGDVAFMTVAHVQLEHKGSTSCQT